MSTATDATTTAASVAEVAKGLTDLVRAGDYEGAMRRYYSEDIVSIEADGPNREVRGMPAYLKVVEAWESMMEVHHTEVGGPYVSGGDTFAVTYKMDATNKMSGQRGIFDEVGVYTVADGKVVRQEFLYGTGSGG